MAALSLVFDLIGKDHSASKTFNDVGDAADRAGTKAGGFGSSIGKAMGFAASAIAAVGITSFGKDLIGLASNAEQSMGGVEAVFKGYADSVKANASAADKALGLSGNAYRELATVIGSQLKNAGVPMEQLGGSTDKLISQGADLAAMFGGTTQEAVDALSSALKGEMDPIEKYGISLNDAALKAEAMSLGLYNGKGNLDANAKAMAVMSLVAKQGADSIGAFSRESDTAAGRQARATAQWENLKTTLGDKLLPVWSSLMGFVGEKVIPGLEKVGAIAGQAFDILFKGDFTGGPLSEDSKAVDVLFRIRDGLVTIGGVARQAFDILFRGDFSGGPLAEDSTAVDILFRLREAFVVLAGFLTGTVVPGFIAVGGAVMSVVGFFQQHQSAVIALGAVIGTVVAAIVAAWIAQAAVSISSSASSVASWFATATASTTSATIQSRSTAQIVVGWLAAGASAIANAAVVVGGWVLMGTQSLLQGARMAAAWVLAMGPVGWVIAAVVGLVALIVANWDTVVSWTKTAWSAVTDFIAAAWEAVKSAVSAGIDAVVGFITGLPGRAVSALSSLGSSIVGVATSAWTSFKDAVSTGIGWVIDLVRSIPGKVVSAIGDLGSTLYNAGKNLIQGLISGAGSLLRNIGRFFLDLVPGWIRGPFESALGISSPSKVFAGYGVNVGEGFIDGIASMQPAVAAQMAALADTQALSALNFSGRTASPTFPAFETSQVTTARPVLVKEENAEYSRRGGRGTTVVGVQNNGPVTYTDTDAILARSFRQAQMAAARFA